ncbi:MAG: hypothetical protein CMP59_04745 [Flavobacteriales bacterium]|nr:hypothetical protein [Flavobacteriales bacterium]
MGLSVDIYDGYSWIMDVEKIEDSSSYRNCPIWKSRIVDLKNFTDQNIKIRFRTIEGNSASSMAFLDNVRLIETNTTPLIISNLKLESSNCRSGSLAEVSFDMSKYTANQIDRDSLSFELYHNGVRVATEHFPMGLDSLDSDTTYVFSHRPNMSLIGKQEIKIKAILSLNGMIYEDSISQEIINRHDQLPYFESFEGLFTECDNLNPNEYNYRTTSGWNSDSTGFSSWRVTDTSSCTYSGSSGMTGAPDTGPLNPKDSSGIMFFISHTDTTADYLYTPCFDLSAYNQAKVEYWHHRYLIYGQRMGILKLEVEHNGQWILIDRVDTNYTQQTANWQLSSIDISPYLSSNTQFRFYLDSSLALGSGIFSHTAIDAFKIFDPLAVGIEESHTHNHSLSVYPNLNNGQFTIEVPEELIGERFEIVDLQGKILYHSKLLRNRMMLNLDLSKGLYLLRLPNSNLSKKLLLYD